MKRRWRTGGVGKLILLTRINIKNGTTKIHNRKTKIGKLMTATETQQHIEIMSTRGIILVGPGIYKVMHDEFFGAIRSKAFRTLSILRVTGWATEDIEKTAYFRKRNPTDYLKLTVYLSNTTAQNTTIDTHFSYLGRRVQMEAAQRWVRLYIRRRSKKRTLAVCMAMHPRLGENSALRHCTPPDVLRSILVAHGVLKYVGAL